MKFKTQKEIRNNFLQDLKRNNCVIFCGAGISMIAPSKLPSGIQLKNQILKIICNQSDNSAFYELLTNNSHYRKIIPEVLFQILYDIISKKTNSFFELLKSNQFNHIHSCLAHLNLKKNTPIYTTNFDLLIEKSVDDNVKVHHIHGRLDKLDSLMMIITKIDEGIPDHQAKAMLKDTENKNLYIFGYSGNDKDVIKILNKSNYKTINWMLIKSDDSWTINNVGALDSQKTIFFVDDLASFFHFINKNLNTTSTVKKNLQKVTYTPPTIPKFEAFKFLELLFFHLNDHNSSIEVCKKAISDNDIKTKDWFHMALADNYRLQGKFDEALSCLTELEKELNNPTVLFHSINIRAIIYLEKQPMEIDKVFKNLEKAQTVLDENTKIQDFDFLYAKLYNNIGLAYYRDGQFSNAINFYKKSLQINRTLNRIIDFASDYSNLSAAYRFSENYQMYYYWEKKAFELYDKYELNYRKGYHLKELGLYYQKKQRIKKSIQMYSRALKYMKKDMSEDDIEIRKILKKINKLKTLQY